MEYKKININDLKEYEKNSRTHSNKQILQIKESIKKFGFTNPLLVKPDLTIIAGHGRLEAVKALNKLDYKALVIADNKIALNAGWDLDILKEELALLENENYNLDLIGFNNDELENIINDSYDSLDYDNLTDNFTIPSNEKSDFRQITITLKAEHADKILQFQKDNQKTSLANGDNYNPNANIIWNLLKDRV